MNHVPLIWGPNPAGGRSAVGLPLPTGWVLVCPCGSIGAGYPTELLARVAADSHVAHDNYVFTYLADPHDLHREAVRRAGPGRCNYVWGGMNWHVTVYPSGSPVLRDPVTGRLPAVRLVWGDVVTITGHKPTAELVVWRPATGQLLR